MMNPWIKFVLDYQKKHNLSYGDALHQAKAVYKKGNSITGRGETVNVPLVRKGITPQIVSASNVSIPVPVVSTQPKPPSQKNKSRENLDFIDQIEARDKEREKQFDAFEARWKKKQEEEEAMEKEKKDKRKKVVSDTPERTERPKSSNKKPCQKIITIKEHQRKNPRCKD